MEESGGASKEESKKIKMADEESTEEESKGEESKGESKEEESTEEFKEEEEESKEDSEKKDDEDVSTVLLVKFYLNNYIYIYLIYLFFC